MRAEANRLIRVALSCAATLLLAGCGKEEASAQVPAAAAAPAQAPAPAPVASAEQSPYSAEALEDLLAPVALYPDPVLMQVLTTSTNPQEVLDAGNWLIQNPALKGKELEKAATTAGFTPPMVALVQFPTVVDMMCMEMDWTRELGTAFQSDQPGVYAAVQRLRVQAKDVGNLKSSEQMKVSTEQAGGQQVIVVQPANPQVVYVPQYDPQVVYTQAPPPVTTTAAPAQTTVVQEGYSGGEMIMTGLLAFGAGILVNEVFDDDDHDDWDYPRWGYGYGGPPYYPPPYRPVYGNGFRPAYGYNRPPNYQHGFNNNVISGNNVVINTGNKDYWNRFDTDKRNNYRDRAQSPISKARPNRPELQKIDAEQRQARADAGDWKGKTTYQGAQAGARDRAAAARTGSGAGAERPAVAGSYAGARDRAQAAPRTPPKAVQTAGTRDRGRVADAGAARPETRQQAQQRPQARPEARQAPNRGGGLASAHQSGRSERAASKRGRESMQRGGGGRQAPQRGGGGHGGGRRN